MLDLDYLGSLIEDPAKRQAWCTLVLRLREASQPGGPLDGWAFHGTSLDRAEWIAREGLLTTTAMPDSGSMKGELTTGTFWGTPAVAAFYAEDLIESMNPSVPDLTLVAVRLVDLEDCGEFVSDGWTVDMPIYTRLDGTESEINARWEASDKGWQACWEHLGTLLVLGMVPAGRLTFINNEEDLDFLLDLLTAPPAIAI